MSKRVMDSREEASGGHRTNLPVSADYQSGSKVDGQIGQQHYQLHQQQGQSDRRRIPDADESSLPPPHLSAATAATTPSSTETVSSRSISEGDQHRPNPPQSKTISSSSTSELHSIPSEHSASWNQPPSPLTASKIPDSEPSFEQISSSSRYGDTSSLAAVKLLVSNNVAGSIIGRSGQTISDLQSQSATRIKLSQAGDYYPGTQDRVCLVQGHSENVKRAVNMLLTRLYALQQQQHYHHYTWQRQQQEQGLMHPEAIIGVTSEGSRSSIIPGFSFVVRILVPTPCCGMIIGKGGTNIKQMVDNSGVSSVRLSPKEGGDSLAPPSQSPLGVTALISATAERVVTITGPDLNSCLTCMHIILDGMTSHPDISRYTNMTTSYTRAVSAASTSHPGSQSTPGSFRRSEAQSDAASSGPPIQDEFAKIERSSSHGQLDRHPATPQNTMGLGSPSTVRTMEPMPNFVPPFNTAPFLPQDTAVRQVQPSSLYLMPSTASFAPAPLTDEHMGIHASHSAPDLLALQMQGTLRLSDPVEGASTAFTGPSSFAHQIPQPTHTPPGFAAQVAVADNLIGSILGRGGRTLNELQVLSNTRIRISQRGEYIPGTRNRVVTIRGPTAQSVTHAQFLMSQRMVLPPTASTYTDRPDYGMNPYDTQVDSGYPQSDVQHQPPS